MTLALELRNIANSPGLSEGESKTLLSAAAMIEQLMARQADACALLRTISDFARADDEIVDQTIEKLEQ